MPSAKKQGLSLNFLGAALLKPSHDAFDLSQDPSNKTTQPICAEMQRSLDKLQQCDHSARATTPCVEGDDFSSH